MSIGENIREARKRLGKSADWLAKEIKCSQSAISQYERDVREPSPKMLYRMSRALNCSVAQLITADYIGKSMLNDYCDWALPYEPNETISKDEYLRFGISFEKLNSEGRRRVFELMEDLTEISRYRIDFGETKQEVTPCPEDVPQTAAEHSPVSDPTDAGK